MSELHKAVMRNQPEEVRFLLSQSQCDIHEIDANGDQPAHIAARQNYIDCMIVLIEYDARMGRKNYHGLTPLGEAVMNGNKEIALLIKDNYTTVTDTYHFHTTTTTTSNTKDDDKTTTTFTSSGERMVVRKIHPKTLKSMKQLECEKMRQAEWEQMWKILEERTKIKEYKCVTTLQSLWRKWLARKKGRQLRREIIAVMRIQRRFRMFMNSKKEVSATRIQSVIRMALTVSLFKARNRESLWLHKATRILAMLMQKLWRGYKARSVYRRLLEMRSLPDPTEIRNFDFWVRCQWEAHPPKVHVGIYAEYILGGTPRSWKERRIKRQGFFRDVAFFANTVTKRVSWCKPNGWISMNYRQSTILRLQLFWRARVIKFRIRSMAKAKRLLEHSRTEGCTKIDHDITSLCNYALFVHAVLNDIDKARDLYSKMMDFMTARGIDNAFVLYSCAVFGAASMEEDWDNISDFVQRAKAADDRFRRRVGDAGRLARCSYHIATAAFRVQALRGEPDPAESWHNYAICQMLVLNDLAGARNSFVQAITLSPHDKRITSNFDYLLQFPGVSGDTREFQS